jgi:hypothetical protein
VRKELDRSEFLDLKETYKRNFLQAKKALERARRQPRWHKARAYWEGVSSAYENAFFWLTRTDKPAPDGNDGE